MCDHEHDECPETDRDTAAISGWLIQQRSPDGQTSGRYLQIGTGQWCPSQYATLFPLRRTAVAYAHEFGYSVGYTAEIVPSRPGSS